MDIESLRKHLSYDPATGVLTWLIAAARRVKPGDEAGCFDRATGRVRVRVAGKMYLRSRVGWALTYGKWPTGEVDHINGDRSDDRSANLRDVPRKVNAQNTRKAKGVYQRGASWAAKITASGRGIHLGTFKSEAEARAAWCAAKRVHAALDDY